MESIFELQRQWHEERERCIDAMVRDMLVEKKTQREGVNSDQRVKSLVDRHEKATRKLINAYNDDSGERNSEVRAISGTGAFAEFYARFKAIKDFHRATKNEPASLLMLEFAKMNNFVEDPDRVEKDMVKFTDEEGYGLYLDLHTVYVKFINLKGVKRISYLNYLTVFDRLFDIPKDPTKKTGAYKEYLSDLKDYLIDFLGRSKPLINVERELELAGKEFDSKWQKGEVPGWESEKKTQNGEAIDLSKYETVEDLEALGLDKLKETLMAMKLKCGGTLRQRAERLFAAKNKSGDELKGLESNEVKEEMRNMATAKMEYCLYKLAELVSKERAATRDNVERKQARGYVPEDESDEEDVVDIVEEVEKDESAPYNPKGLPLAWDGKPIPYWLYKLHGLNISYSCEICGNQVYKGPKVFARHFSEWRHSHGMRCLGIPNTPHFAHITKIADAMALWKELQTKNETSWNPDMDEECEDSKGNVVNRRTYEDLIRQGLL